MSFEDPNWKLLLRYGRLETPYKHFTVLADGRVLEPMEGLATELGPAWLGMKVWASTADEAAALVQAVAPELGFEIQGRIEIYGTEPERPPDADPLGYDPHFTPYTE